MHLLFSHLGKTVRVPRSGSGSVFGLGIDFGFRSRSASAPASALVFTLQTVSALAVSVENAWGIEAAEMRVVDPQTPVFVTGNPLGAAELSASTTALSGPALHASAGDSLGALLDGLPGVASTAYGPMVGRPILRGMDGDRIRILQNGVAAYDAAALSFDHAVPQDPFAIKRVEIIRGPAALLYGGNAIGGVVNTIDNRIPRTPMRGIAGSTDLRYGGANRSRGGAAQIEIGTGRFQFHVDAFARRSGLLTIPGHARSDGQRALDGPVREQPFGILPNSDGRWNGGALGGAYHWADGYAGLSYSSFDGRYGAVAEPGARIVMKQQRLAGAAEVRNISGPFDRARLDLALSRYRHTETEDGIAVSNFRNRGIEGRLELRHRPITMPVGDLSGALGLQFAEHTFSTPGPQRLLPATRTRSLALFATENWQLSPTFSINAGARVEQTCHRPESTSGKARAVATAAAGNGALLPAAQRFTAVSAALGSLYHFAPRWTLATNAAYSERAPTSYELYADGPHHATGQYLIGKADAKKETSLGAEMALRFADGPHRANLGVFYSRYQNYLAEYPLAEAGSAQHAHEHLHQEDHHHDHHHGHGHSHGHSLKRAEYRGVRAEFFGGEALVTRRVFARAGHDVRLTVGSDYTVARNVATGQALPRIAPLRVTLRGEYRYGPLYAETTVIHALRQSRVPEHDTMTNGYTTLAIALHYRFRTGRTQWLAYLRGDNLTDQVIRYASSSARTFAPQGGRSATVGLHTTF